MKPVRTPESNVTLELVGGSRDNDLPAMRFLAYDASIGQTKEDARPAWETIWRPGVEEAAALEAGALVKLIVFGEQHPPVSVGVTDALLPEQEIILRGHVDRAIGHLYAALTDRLAADVAGELPAKGWPEPPEFVDLWNEAVDATRPDHAGGPTTPPADPEPDPVDPPTLDADGLKAAFTAILGPHANVNVDEIPGGGLMVRANNVTGLHRDTAVMAQGHDHATILKRLKRAVNDAAQKAEHREDPS